MKPRPFRRRTIDAFTLIELLVVISVIALLIGILLPVLGSTRESARTLACLSNSRQHAVAVATFTNDHEGRMPLAVTYNLSFIGPSPTANGGAEPLSARGGPLPVLPAIGEALAPYFDLEGGDTAAAEPPKIWKCPSVDGDPGWTAPAYRGGTFDPHYYYLGTLDLAEIPADAAFPFTNADEWGARNVANLTVDRVASAAGQSASEIVAIVDESSTNHSGDVYSGDADDYRSNFAYADGHAATVGYRDPEAYVAALHEEVPQRQFGLDLVSIFSDAFADTP